MQRLAATREAVTIAGRARLRAGRRVLPDEDRVRGKPARANRATCHSESQMVKYGPRPMARARRTRSRAAKNPTAPDPVAGR